MKYEVTNNAGELQFEIREGQDIAFLQYRYYKKDIALMHTVVPPALGGKGMASALAEFAFTFAKKESKPVMVYCPFVAAYVKRHPEVKEQLDREYHH